MIRLQFFLFLILSFYCSSPTGFAQSLSRDPSKEQSPLTKVNEPFGGPGQAVVRFTPNGKSFARYRSAGSIGFFSATISLFDLHLYDTATGKKQLSVEDGWKGFTFSPDSTKLFSWDKDAIFIWDIQEAKLQSKLHISMVTNVQFVRSGAWFVTESMQNESRQGEVSPSIMKFWDAASLKPVETPIHQKGPWWTPVVTPDGKILIGFEQNKCSIVEVETGRELPVPRNVTPGQIFGPRTRVTSDGRYVIFNAWLREHIVEQQHDGFPFVLWDLTTAKPLEMGAHWSITALSKADTSSSLSDQIQNAFHSNDLDLSDILIDNVSKRWVFKSMLTGELLRELPDRTSRQSLDNVGVSLTSNSRMLVSLMPRNTPKVKLLDIREGSLATIVETQGDIRNAAVSLDGNRLAFSEVCTLPTEPIAEKIAIWDIRIPKQICSIDRYQSPKDYWPINSIYFSPDDKLIAAVPRRLEGDRSELEILSWDSSTGHAFETGHNQELPTRIVGISHDRKLLASPQPNELHILDSKSFELKQKLIINDLPSKKGYVTPELGTISRAVFSNDNSRIVLLSWFNNAQYLTYWDLPNGQLRFLTRLPSTMFDVKLIDQGESIQLASLAPSEVVVYRLGSIEEKGKDRYEDFTPSTSLVIRLPEVFDRTYYVGNLADGQAVVAGCTYHGERYRTKLFQIDINTAKIAKTFEIDDFNTEGVVAAAKEHRLVLRGFSTHGHSVYILDSQSGDVVSRLDDVRLAAKSPNGKYILVKDQQKQGVFRVCDTEDGAELGRFTFPQAMDPSIEFSSDSKYFLLSREGGLSVWSIDQFR